MRLHDDLHLFIYKELNLWNLHLSIYKELNTEKMQSLTTLFKRPLQQVARHRLS